MASPKVVRWGIMATGGIARTFTKDLLTDPTTRSVHDIKHVITAVASSSFIESARSFIKDVISPKQQDHCTPYASYKELVQDPNVDLIYIASPHSHHYQNARLCLTHGKPVLCEKALTVNAAQAAELYRLAKEKKLFFMEAVWTRFFPLSIEVRRLIGEGSVGEVIRVFADLSIGYKDPGMEWTDGHRMVAMELAGGALLDLGVYSLTWVFQTLYHTLPASQRKAPIVTGAAMTAEPRTGADESTLMLLEFPCSPPSGKFKAHAVATTAMRVPTDPAAAAQAANAEHETPAVRIQGTVGEIQVYGPIYRPMRYKLFRPGEDVVEREFTFPGGAHGMMYEADEAARCFVQGRLESETMGWEESLVIMQTMDEVRRKVGLTYPESIESVEYPLDLSRKI